MLPFLTRSTYIQINLLVFQTTLLWLKEGFACFVFWIFFFFLVTLVSGKGDILDFLKSKLCGNKIFVAKLWENFLLPHSFDTSVFITYFKPWSSESSIVSLKKWDAFIFSPSSSSLRQVLHGGTWNEAGMRQSLPLRCPNPDLWLTREWTEYNNTERKDAVRRRLDTETEVRHGDGRLGFLRKQHDQEFPSWLSG